jgi:hypothetical protein
MILLRRFVISTPRAKDKSVCSEELPVMILGFRRRRTEWKRRFLAVALAALTISEGCNQTSEEGTIDPGAAGLKPQRVHVKGEKAAPGDAQAAKKGR